MKYLKTYNENEEYLTLEEAMQEYVNYLNSEDISCHDYLSETEDDLTIMSTGHYIHRNGVSKDCNEHNSCNISEINLFGDTQFELMVGGEIYGLSEKQYQELLNKWIEAKIKSLDYDEQKKAIENDTDKYFEFKYLHPEIKKEYEYLKHGKNLGLFEKKLISTRDEGEFRIKDFDIFSNNQNDSYLEEQEIYDVKLQEVPEMNTMHDWAKWMVDKIPKKDKLKFIKDIKTFEKKKFIPKEATPAELKKRWDKKRNAITTLKKNIKNLKRRVDSDLNSKDERTQIIAAVAKIILMTGERVGNESSKEEGHHGVTNLKKKHISVNGDNITLKYTGKSGVDHDRTIKNGKVASVLKKLLKRPSQEVFVTESGFSIRAPQINTYLSQFDITSKDLRGFRSNKLMVGKLSKMSKTKDKKQIKKNFNDALRDVASNIGHSPQILRSAYILPEIEETYYKRGSIGYINI